MDLSLNKDLSTTMVARILGHVKNVVLLPLLKPPYSIPSIVHYCGENPLHCNFPGNIFHKGSFQLPSHEENKLARSDEAIHLTSPHTSGWGWYRGLDFHFLPPPPFWAVCFCIFSRLIAHWLCIQNLVEFGSRA